MERGSIFMAGRGWQLASLRRCSGARGGKLPRWFKLWS